MADNPHIAVTAIRDMSQEGFIASSLTRLGWKVAHRATDINSLLSFAEQNPDCIIIASDDFKGINQSEKHKILFIRGLTQGLVSKAIDSPRSDPELHQLLQALIHNTDNALESLPPFTSKVYVFASIGRNVGTTTLAINVAAESVADGYRVLLIDADIEYPSFSLNLGLHGLRQRIVETPYGFSATEIDSIQRMREVSEMSAGYDLVILDLGQLRMDERTSSGRRLTDLVTSWAINSAETLYLVCEKRRGVEHQISKVISPIKRVTKVSSVQVVITARAFLGRRERESFIADCQREIESPIHFIPYDRKSIEIMDKDFSPLIACAPKSPVRTVIQQLIHEGEKRSHLKFG
jgi:hypothetical protein